MLARWLILLQFAWVNLHSCFLMLQAVLKIIPLPGLLILPDLIPIIPDPIVEPTVTTTYYVIH